jgi:hypothetical protein
MDRRLTSAADRIQMPENSFGMNCRATAGLPINTNVSEIFIFSRSNFTAGKCNVRKRTDPVRAWRLLFKFAVQLLPASRGKAVSTD